MIKGFVCTPRNPEGRETGIFVHAVLIDDILNALLFLFIGLEVLTFYCPCLERLRPSAACCA
jgi:hypothetical protein